MYHIEGRVTTAKDPKDLIGKYGIYSRDENRYVPHRGVIGAVSRERWATGSEKIVTALANRWRRKGKIPVYAQVEHITSLEQAERYPRSTEREVDISRFREPDLEEVLNNNKVTKGEEVTNGIIRLWKELRIPSPYIYVLALGKLLGKVRFDPESSMWLSEWPPSDAKRKTMGIVTPIARLTATTTETRQTLYRR